MVVTFGFLGFAFYLTYRPRRTTAAQGGPRSNIMTMNKVMLWAVTVIAVVFLFFPQAFTSFGAADDQFTADMDRTVISIEGMT
jgi:heme/copper-type cytochrome/quinol oxidase subunit 2